MNTASFIWIFSPDYRLKVTVAVLIWPSVEFASFHYLSCCCTGCVLRDRRLVVLRPRGVEGWALAIEAQRLRDLNYLLRIVLRIDFRSLRRPRRCLLPMFIVAFLRLRHPRPSQINRNQRPWLFSVFSSEVVLPMLLLPFTGLFWIKIELFVPVTQII